MAKAYNNWMTRHFILYSKGHYQKSNDRIADLRTLLSNATGTPRALYTDTHIYSFLIESASECLTRHDLSELLKCFYHKPFFLGTGSATLDEMIQHILGMMACIQIREQDDGGNWYDLVDLGEPDKRYLPLTNKEDKDAVPATQE